MDKSLQELADILDGRLIGDPSVRISGLGTLDNAVEGQITFLANPKYADKVATTCASAVVLSFNANSFNRNAIVVENPYFAFAKLLTLFATCPRVPRGIMKGAFVGEDVVIGKDVSIFPGTVVGNGVRIGDRVTLHPNVTLYEGVVLGDDVTLHAGASVREGCRIGSRVIIHNGTVIGSDGFGYAPDGQSWLKIPQIGIVIIEDDVELGANVTIDRAALESTVIGRGTKIDNLVHVAHNCVIGEDCVIMALAGIAGSAQLGRHVSIGGQVGIIDHIIIDENAKVSFQSGVIGNVATGEVLSGTPAIPHRAWLKSSAVFPQLPESRKSLATLNTRISIIEKELKSIRNAVVHVD
jgi:UDP-3-O-[3-hydroxymyristoyl] glucosamine N-acyltransferase